MKTNKSIFDRIQNAPLLQKGFAAVVIVGIVALLLRIRQGIKSKEAKTSIGIKGNGEILETRAKVLAEILFDAMRVFGTDEEAIDKVYDELCMYDKAILQVHEQFGSKGYALGAADWLGVKLNLRQWLKKDLSAKEFAKWEYLYNKATNE